VLRLVLGHPLRKVAIDTAGAIVGSVQPRPGHGFVYVEQVLALAKRVEKRRHAADVERVRAYPEQMVQDPRDLVEHHTDVLRAKRDLDSEQPLDREAIRVLVAHHRHVIQPVHVRQRLQVGLVFGEFFRRPMQEPDVRIRALDDLSVELEHQPQHAVRSRVLGPEVHRVVANFSHGIGRAYRIAPDSVRARRALSAPSGGSERIERGGRSSHLPIA